MKSNLELKGEWEQFGKKDPHYYILSDNIDYSSEDWEKDFYESGKKFTSDSLDRIKDYLKDNSSALEIGCGLGRLTIPHSAHFGQISAVDISQNMLVQLEENCKKRGITNINTFLSDSDWDRKEYNYVYSYLVFQHIANWNYIQDYIHRISGCLAKNGIAQLHFDTRPKTSLYRLRALMPDGLLPKSMKTGIQRIRRSPLDLENLFERNNLGILREFNGQGEEHTYLLQKL